MISIFNLWINDIKNVARFSDQSSYLFKESLKYALLNKKTKQPYKRP